MSNIKFFCLIQGTNLDKCFKIAIDKNSDIADLKDNIWEKNKNTFSNIDANDLILWKVKIPISEKEKFKQLKLNKSTIEDVLGGTKLDDATVEVEEIFGNSPAKNLIHIIIGRPTTEQSTQSLSQEIQSPIQQNRTVFLKKNRTNLMVETYLQANINDSLNILSSYLKSTHNSLQSGFRQSLSYDETNPFRLSLFDQNKQNSGMDSRTRFDQPPFTYNILLLGGTGTGKSTIINMMANYFLGGTLENLKVVIPTKYLKVTENAFVKNNSEAKIEDVTRSQTTNCCNYEFKHPENSSYNFIFIDTPGMSDTNGIEQDDKNIQEIIDTAIKIDLLTAIIIIASGTEARVTPTMKNTLVRLSNNLPDEIISNNLLLILTKCTKSSACFSVKDFSKEIAKPKQIFYMDNQVFCSDPQIWQNDDDEYSTVQHQWNKSFKTFDHLLKKVIEMNATSAKAFTIMRELRNKIKSEIVAISQTTVNIQQVQDKLEATRIALESAGDQKKNFVNYTTTEEITVKVPIKKDTKNTVCTIHERDGIICHEDCQLEFTGTSGKFIFLRCTCIRFFKCTKCGCDAYNHYHTNIEMKTETKTIEKVLEDIKAQYDMANENHKKISNNANQFQQTFADLQAKADANYNRIRQLCTDLSKICSRFNFVDELHANIMNMRMDAKALQNSDLREKAESDIMKLETYIDGLSKRQG